jgi:hypothetical protein
MSRDDDIVQIPDIIHDVNTNISYKKGRFFGKVSAVFVEVLRHSDRLL